MPLPAPAGGDETAWGGGGTEPSSIPLPAACCGTDCGATGCCEGADCVGAAGWDGAGRLPTLASDALA